MRRHWQPPPLLFTIWASNSMKLSFLGSIIDYWRRRRYKHEEDESGCEERHDQKEHRSSGHDQQLRSIRRMSKEPCGQPRRIRGGRLPGVHGQRRRGDHRRPHLRRLRLSPEFPPKGRAKLGVNHYVLYIPSCLIAIFFCWEYFFHQFWIVWSKIET